MPTAYDNVPYPSAVYPQTHPDRLATIGHLFGLTPARVESARVLELGCGDGTNITAMALTLPQSQFCGLDLASAPIRKGKKVVAALNLANVRLEQMDLLETPADLGQFDFIIAHGLYSWVPPEAREKILAICRGHLAEQGIAYISYNSYPGNHLRDLVRSMIRFHVRQFPEPQEQVRQARILIKFLATAKAKESLWQQVLRQQFDRIQRYVDAGFFHDDLSAANQPFYFYEFAEAAARHKLQFLAEADLTDMQVAGLTDEAQGVLRNLEQCNLVAREQYLDFIEGRSFRQTLLCHEERALERDLKPERAQALWIAADSRPAKPKAGLTGPAMEDFQRGKAVIATSHPALKCALGLLGEVWPRRVHFQELLEQARSRAGREDGGPAVSIQMDAQDLGEFLLRCYMVGFVDLHAHPSVFVTKPSAHPVASPLARLQIQQGPVVVSLRHLTLKIEDRLGQELLKLLDGTRDREQIARQLADLVQSGKVPLPDQGAPVTAPEQMEKRLREGLDHSLQNLARLGLLVNPVLVEKIAGTIMSRKRTHRTQRKGDLDRR